METKVNYTLVGIFVTAFLAASIIVGLWLSTGLKTENYKIYQVYMDESVSGLSVNAPVKYNGVEIGSVTDIELNLNNPQQVILTLQIKPATPITQTTTAILMEQGITGIAYLGLKAGKPAPLLKAKPGQKYPIIPSKPSFLMKLDATLENLSDNINTMTDHVRDLLSQDNVEAVRKSLKNIRIITANIAKNSKEIDSTLKDLKIVMHNTADASEQFPQIMDAIQKGSESIQQFSENLSKTTKEMNNTLDQSDIAIESFTNNILPQTYNAIKNIKQVTGNLKGLSSELKRNPSVIIKGVRPARPGPGE